MTTVWRAARDWLTPQTVVVVATLLAVVLGLVLIDRGPGGGSDPGDAAIGYVSGESTDEDLVAPLPYGSLRIRTESGRTARIDGDDHDAGDSQRWVQVTTTYRAEGGADPDAGATRPAAAPERTKVEPEPTSNPYQPTARCSNAAGGKATAGVVPLIGCSAEVTRRDFVAGLGWAPRGKEWLVVEAKAGSTRGLTGEDPPIAEWSSTKGAGEESVEYRIVGKPRLTVEVEGAGRPARTHGRAKIDGAAVTLETRAYLVPATASVRLTTTYRAEGVADPDQGKTRPAAAPERTKVDAAATQTVTE